MISKKLLSEVLGVKVTAIDTEYTDATVKSNEIDIMYIKDGVSYGFSDDCKFNIYELAHKCKEWAVTQGFEIIEELNIVRVISLSPSTYIEDIGSNNYRVSSVFKACELILKELNV